jgi:hypothetical protein
MGEEIESAIQHATQPIRQSIVLVSLINTYGIIIAHIALRQKD